METSSTLLLTFIKNGLYLVIAYILILSATTRMQDNPEFSSHYCSLRFSSWADRPSSSFYINFDCKHLFLLEPRWVWKRGNCYFTNSLTFLFFLTVVPQVETLWKDVLFLASPLVAMVPFLHSDLFLLSCLLGKLWLSGGSMQTVRGQPWTARLPAESNCY